MNDSNLNISHILNTFDSAFAAFSFSKINSLQIHLILLFAFKGLLLTKLTAEDSPLKVMSKLKLSSFRLSKQYVDDDNACISNGLYIYSYTKRRVVHELWNLLDKHEIQLE